MIFGFLFTIFSFTANAQTYFSLEASQIWQSRNDQRIPGSTGTLFSISDISGGPFTGCRAYVGHIWDNRHELRALYAPLEIEVQGAFTQPVNFQDATFAANTQTTFLYKFNSYRLTYAYHLDRSNNWRWAVGFTAKVRDAEVGVKQNALNRSKSNVGFVPLLNFQARYEFSNEWLFRFDLDGLAAPQGRAFDGSFFLERKLGSFYLFGGYRTIEGGADNKEVYNFAWIHQAVFGLTKLF